MLGVQLDSKIDSERFPNLTQGPKNVKIEYPQNPGEKDP